MLIVLLGWLVFCLIIETSGLTIDINISKVLLKRSEIVNSFNKNYSMKNPINIGVLNFLVPRSALKKRFVLCENLVVKNLSIQEKYSRRKPENIDKLSLKLFM